MRLLMVTPNFPPAIGGVQNYAEALAASFCRQADHFAVLAAKHEKATGHDTRYPYEVRRATDPGDNFALSAALPLKTWLSQESFDAIFATHWSAAFCARMATHGRLPIGCAVHGKEVHIDPLGRIPGLGRGYRYARRAALRRSILFPVSHYTAQTVRTHFPKHGPLHVVNNGVDASLFRPLEPSPKRKAVDAPVILTVGRLVARKGVDTVLRALAQLSEIRFEYWIVGEGPMRASLEQLTEELRLKENVRFFGSVASDQLVQFYSDCDVFVMTPRDIAGDVEGFGLVFLEAAACGKPVIGARSGGVADALVDGHNGYLVEPDDPDALADRLGSLLADKSLRERLGQRGVAHAEACSWDQAAESILKTLFVSK